MPNTDVLQRFLFEHETHAVRGELVFLRDVFQTIAAQRDYPPKVAELLGKSLAATALLSATLKYKGSLILQAQTTGPVHLLVVQSDHDLNLRGLAKWQPDGDFSGRLLGDGQMVITISPHHTTDRHQGVVELISEELAQNLERYFEQSEQLPTKLWLVAGHDQAVGFLIQKMPKARGDEAAESHYWEHLQALAATITEQELLTLSAETILHRLFHEENIRLYEPQPLHFQCRCDKAKMTQALHTMGEEEVRDILRAHSLVEVTCDFCNNSYAFTAQEIDEAFPS